MTKTVKIWFSTTDEIKEIIAKYAGVTVDKVGLGKDDDGNFFAVVEKELTFPEEKQTITRPYSPWDVIPIGINDPNPLNPYHPNPLNPDVTWTSADALSNRYTITTQTVSDTNDGTK